MKIHSPTCSHLQSDNPLTCPLVWNSMSGCRATSPLPHARITSRPFSLSTCKDQISHLHADIKQWAFFLFNVSTVQRREPIPFEKILTGEQKGGRTGDVKKGETAIKRGGRGGEREKKEKKKEIRKGEVSFIKKKREGALIKDPQEVCGRPFSVTVFQEPNRPMHAEKMGNTDPYILMNWSQAPGFFFLESFCPSHPT